MEWIAIKSKVGSHPAGVLSFHVMSSPCFLITVVPHSSLVFSTLLQAEAEEMGSRSLGLQLQSARQRNLFQVFSIFFTEKENGLYILSQNCS